MRIAIVTSRLCDSGDQLALRRFVCCEPNGPEYAMDVQRYIRGLRVKDEPGMYRMVLQYGETPNAPIVGFLLTLDITVLRGKIKSRRIDRIIVTQSGEIN